jgi:transposase
VISVPATAGIYLHTRPTDMRKSFDGLCAIVREQFAADPLDGSLFVFLNKRRDRLKLLWWDRDGLAIWYKRLEKGSFEGVTSEQTLHSIDAAQLAMLLTGVPLAAPRRPRYQRTG